MTKDVRLNALPGAKGYWVDIEGRKAYSSKRGVLRRLKFRTKYQTASISIDGKSYGTSIWRMLYCTINDIDIRKIPGDLCISPRNGEIVVTDRRDARGAEVVLHQG